MRARNHLAEVFASSGILPGFAHTWWDNMRNCFGLIIDRGSLGSYDQDERRLPGCDLCAWSGLPQNSKGAEAAAEFQKIVDHKGVNWSTSSTVSRALALIDEGALDGTVGTIEKLAERLGIGERQLCRLFLQHLGASPISVAQARRVLFAQAAHSRHGVEPAVMSSCFLLHSLNVSCTRRQFAN